MASKPFFPLQSLGREYKLLAGSFAPNGSSAVDAASNLGKGFTVARTGVGAFLVTLDSGLTFPALVSAGVDLQLNAAADSVAQIGAVDLTARTMVIRILTAGVASDSVTANANNRVHFSLLFRNTVNK